MTAKTHHAIVDHVLVRLTREPRETAEELANEARIWRRYACLALFCAIFTVYFWPAMLGEVGRQDDGPC